MNYLLDLSDLRVKEVLGNWIRTFAKENYTDEQIEIISGDFLKHLLDVATDQEFHRQQVGPDGS